MNVPGFIAKQFYVAGSLRNDEAGWQLQAQNPMGDGVLVGVGRLAVDGREINREDVTAQRGDGSEPISAMEVDPMHPVEVYRGDTVTLHVDGERLAPGEHKLEVELYERNLGRLAFSITDRIAE